MDVISKITHIIEPTVQDMGYELVRVLFQGDDLNRTLQVMAERIDRQDMKVEDCEALSKAISALLDVEDPIERRYVLEVTSPGIDRPLIKAQDFVRFAGHEFKMETMSPINGRKRFKGQLLGLDAAQENVRMVFEGQELSVPLSLVGKAKLVLTDELVASFLKNK